MHPLDRVVGKRIVGFFEFENGLRLVLEDETVLDITARDDGSIDYVVYKAKKGEAEEVAVV